MLYPVLPKYHQVGQREIVTQFYTYTMLIEVASLIIGQCLSCRSSFMYDPRCGLMSAALYKLLFVLFQLGLSCLFNVCCCFSADVGIPRCGQRVFPKNGKPKRGYYRGYWWWTVLHCWSADGQDREVQRCQTYTQLPENIAIILTWWVNTEYQPKYQPFGSLVK